MSYHQQLQDIIEDQVSQWPNRVKYKKEANDREQFNGSTPIFGILKNAVVYFQLHSMETHELLRKEFWLFFIVDHWKYFFSQLLAVDGWKKKKKIESAS